MNRVRYEKASSGDPDEGDILFLPTNLSLYDSIFFNWVTPLIKHCKENTLGSDDIFRLPPQLTSKELYLKFSSLWNESKSRTNADPKLWNVIADVIYVDFWTAGFCRLMSDLLVLLSAILVKQFIIAAQSNSQIDMLAIACLFLSSSVLQAVMLQQFIHGSFMAGIYILHILAIFRL